MNTRTQQLDSEWIGVTVSSGTLRHEDLVPVFLAVLREVDPRGADKLDRGYHRGLAYGDPETPGATLEYLVDALNSVAPSGSYFGSHEGDGACFGFWTDGALYGLHGGSSFVLAELPTDGLADGVDWFWTIDDAAREWARRRQDWTGRFPCWGDSGPDADAVYAVDLIGEDGDVYECWTPRELVDLIGDIEHYYDPACWEDEDEDEDED